MSRSLTVLLLVVLGIGLWLAWSRSAQASIGTLNIYTGSAELVSDDSVRAGQTGMAIHKNDVIRAGNDSRISIILHDGSVFRLEAGTEIRIKELLYDGTSLKRAGIELETGKVWAKVQPVQDNGQVYVETPTIVAAVRGTSYNTVYLQPWNEVYVSTGRVGVRIKTGSGEKLLSAGSVFRVRDTGSGAVTMPQGAKDDWIRFNEEEDAKLGAVPSSSSNSSSSLSSSVASSAAASSLRASSAGTTLSSRAASAAAVQTASAAMASSAALSSRAAVSSAATQGATLQRLELTTPQTAMPPNEDVQLTLTAHYSDGTSSKPTQVQWTVVPAEAGFVNASHVFHSLKEGKVSIRATVGTVQSNGITIDVLTSTPPQVTLSSVTVRCAKQTSTQYRYGSAQCSAMAGYSDGSSKDVTAQSQWGASGTAKGQVDQNGFYAAAAEGTDTVTAAFGGKTGSTTITNP